MTSKKDLFNDPEFLNAIFDSTESGTLIIDYTGNILAVNNELVSITGHAREELEGTRNWKSIIDAEDEDVIGKYIQLLRADPEEFSDRLEISFRNREGEEKTCYLKGFPVPGKPLIILSLTDITEQKEYETELQKAKEKAETSERLKTAFLANMSHEIRTPMNAIVGFASLLKSEEVPEEKKLMYLNQVIHGSHDLLLLIEKIISVSRLDSGQLKLNNREFDLNNRLKDIQKKYQEEIVARGKENIEIGLSLGKKEDGFKVLGDPIRISEVINNLLENAVKFTDEGSIEFGYYYLDGESQEKEDSLLFFVKDTGTGIAKDKLRVIFDRFVKIIEKEETIYKGAGLGLSIARDLVSLFGGTIWAESTKGSGSKFYFSYPLSKVRAVRKSLDTVRLTGEDVEDWSDKLLLVAEDVESNYLYIKELLAPSNVRILRARDGLEAVDLFAENRDIDAVIMDILMPGLDGYEATDKIRQMQPDIPVIAQTAFTFEGDMQDGLYAGCFNDYIMKPYTRKVLMGVIKKYLPAESE